MWPSRTTVIAAVLVSNVGGFPLPHAKRAVKLNFHCRSDLKGNCDEVSETRRRIFLGASFVLGEQLLSTVGASPAFAISKQEDIDKANLVKGYQRLQYLLDNWEKETTVCGMGGDKLESSCDRTPMKVMEYMGYKSTTDPLYKADKTLRRLYEDAPANRDSEFIEAIEVFAENAEEASGMAFVSSWGEANPGGGKDRVELFIERSKKNVIASRDSLKTVIDILELDASKKN